MNLIQIAQMTEDEARDYLEKLRWPNGVECAHCNSSDVVKLMGKSTIPGTYKCRECRKKFTVRVGTILHGSHIPLVKWILAFYLVCSSKKGMSAHQIHRTLDLTYKTAWHLVHRIRHCMREEPLQGMLSGTVEVDETYVGGKTRGGKRGRGAENKTPVMVLVERNGQARSKPVESVSGKELKGEIKKNVETSSTIMTDEWSAYNGIGKDYAGGHHTVNHSAGEYSRGDVYTNTAESFFSLIKRGHYGTFHKMSKKHLHRYVDEFTFRWNHRKATDFQRTEAALRCAPGKRLMYQEPISLDSED